MNRRAHAACLVLVIASAPLQAYDINEHVSISGVIAGAGQCEDVSGVPGGADECRAALPVQPAIGITPTDADEFLFGFGFAVGNGLNAVTPFAIAPWAADLEDDVVDINGRNRSYLLQAWYKHTFTFSDEHTLGATLGIIDATAYLDENAYANDEYTQFMNSALVNGPNVFLPSYDAGGALEWDVGNWSVRGVFMNIGENDDGENYNFAGAQIGYRAETSLGEGNYRFIVDTTSEAFLNPAGTSFERLTAVLLSFDQQLGQNLGAFIRFGWQDDSAAVDYKSIYSGGFDISGKLWGRSDDNVGVGFAYLDGGNLNIDHTYVAETYYRATLNDYFAITADLQYMNDDYVTGDGPDGVIFGIRATAEF